MDADLLYGLWLLVLALIGLVGISELYKNDDTGGW